MLDVFLYQHSTLPPIISYFVTQITSCYGLLSTEMIVKPVPTGSKVTLPYYSGCRYAAIPARSDQEVYSPLYSLMTLMNISIKTERNCDILPGEAWVSCVPWEGSSCLWLQGMKILLVLDNYNFLSGLQVQWIILWYTRWSTYHVWSWSRMSCGAIPIFHCWQSWKGNSNMFLKNIWSIFFQSGHQRKRDNSSSQRQGLYCWESKNTWKQ